MQRFNNLQNKYYERNKTSSSSDSNPREEVDSLNKEPFSTKNTNDNRELFYELDLNQQQQNQPFQINNNQHSPTSSSSTFIKFNSTFNESKVTMTSFNNNNHPQIQHQLHQQYSPQLNNNDSFQMKSFSNSNNINKNVENESSGMIDTPDLSNNNNNNSNIHNHSHSNGLRNFRKEGDENVIEKFYKLGRKNIVIRWFFFITPILALLWIPGVIGLCFPEKNFRVAGVKLRDWSIWLSISWLGWWKGLIFGSIVPHLFKHTIGIALPQMFVEKWFGYLSSMRKCLMGIVWSFSTWLAFNIFIIRNYGSGSENNKKYLNLTLQGLFGIYISSILLIAEKLLIQIIAGDFHKKSYEDRIQRHKECIGYLVTLYRHTRDIGRNDTLDRAYQVNNNNSHDGSGFLNSPPPVKIIKNALRGVKSVAQSTTSIFGTVASEIAGEQILQPNSASSLVNSSLTSPNKTRQLARRIYYSFVPVLNRKFMVLGDIVRCFEGNFERAKEAFNFLDQDENGDCNLVEIELVLSELHKERIALGSSMRDLDSAVGRLDSILMFFWYIVSLLIIVALLDISFQTMIASAGTLILGLSWLIGSAAQEILASIIFLFVKHPYDVGDRVDVDGSSYVVKEMHLLYTVFKQTDGQISQLPHSILNTKTVVNIRRSGSISETFKWDVEFNTTSEQIEKINLRMNEFVKNQRRDYLDNFNVFIKEFDGQTSMTLQADIKYKSNWQNGALKAQRRNKWICALKRIMAEESIFGPGGSGNPNPIPEPQLIQLVDPIDPNRIDKPSLFPSKMEPIERNNKNNEKSSAPLNEAGGYVDEKLGYFDIGKDRFGNESSNLGIQFNNNNNNNNNNESFNRAGGGARVGDEDENDLEGRAELGTGVGGLLDYKNHNKDGSGRNSPYYFRPA